ncbi:MAG: LolA family protein, partial [Anaerolineae bacterium]
MKAKFWIVIGLLLVLGLVLAGCGPQITAEEIVDKMRETLESTDDAHAIVAVDVSAQGIEMSAKAEVWEMSPNKFRAEVLESSQPDTEGMIMVSDGQQGWFYDPAHNQVMVGD